MEMIREVCFANCVEIASRNVVVERICCFYHYIFLYQKLFSI